jgi:hypothetical protein
MSIFITAPAAATLEKTQQYIGKFIFIKTSRPYGRKRYIIISQLVAAQYTERLKAHFGNETIL